MNERKINFGRWEHFPGSLINFYTAHEIQTPQSRLESLEDAALPGPAIAALVQMSNVFQDPDANTIFVLRLKPKVGYGWKNPAIMRLRAVHKRLLRTYGFVCLPNPKPKETHDNTNPTGH